MGRRSMSCSGSLVLLFAGCVFVSMAAAQHGNSVSPGAWTTATLSVGRDYLAATSLPNDGLAIFAGGVGASYVFMSVIGGGGVWGGGGCVGGATCAVVAAASDWYAGSASGYFNTVDIFNATSGVWTVAALSVARAYLAATSLPNDGLAIFGGGAGASYLLMSVIAGGGV